LFLGLFLVGAFSFCCIGCGPSGGEVTETETEVEEDLDEQEAMMDEEMDADSGGETAEE